MQPPPLIRHSIQKVPFTAALKLAHKAFEKEDATGKLIQNGTIPQFHKKDPTKCGSRPYQVEVFDALKLVTLPDALGRWKADVRPLIADVATPIFDDITFDRAVSQQRDEKDATGSKKNIIITTGNINAKYLQRILSSSIGHANKEGESKTELGGNSKALEDIHVVVVEKRMSSLLDLVEEMTSEDGIVDMSDDIAAKSDARNCERGAINDNSRFLSRCTFVRGDLFFALQKLFQPCSVSAIVIGSPPIRPTITQSHQRLVVRDLFAASHRVLKERDDNNDPKGILMWTNDAPLFDFSFDQLEEAKLMCPWAKKNPQVFGDLLPHEGELLRHADVRDLHYLATTKKGPCPAPTLAFVDNYSYERRYYEDLRPKAGNTSDRRGSGKRSEGEVVIKGLPHNSGKNPGGPFVKNL